MKPIISGSGTGKNVYMTKFFVNNIYDKIISCAYYGTSFDYENMKHMLSASNNPILMCDDLKPITLSLEKREVGTVGLPEPLSRQEAVSLLTTSENNFFAIEESTLVCAALSSFRFELIEDVNFYLITTTRNIPVIFGARRTVINKIGECMVICTPIWSTPEFFCSPFQSELPVCIYFEGVCPICTKVVTRRIIERPRFTITNEEAKFLDKFCAIIGAERDFANPNSKRIPIIPRSKWDEEFSDKGLEYEQYVRGARLYNKALRSIGGDAYEYDPTKVNESFDTLVYFDKVGSHRLSFNPYKRILDSHSLVFVDSLTCMLWCDVGNQSRSKGGVPTDLLTTIQTTTFSNVRPLYVPNPSFDPFGGASFNEMIGGSFVSSYSEDGHIGNMTWIGDRRSGRIILEPDTAVFRLNMDSENANDLSIAVDHQNQTVVIKLYKGPFYNNSIIDLFVSTEPNVYYDFITEVVNAKAFDVSSYQTYDPESFPPSYKTVGLVSRDDLYKFILRYAVKKSAIYEEVSYDYEQSM